MPFVSILNVVEVEFQSLVESQKCENTLYFQHEDAVTVENMTELAGVLESWYSSIVLGNISSNVHYVATVVTDLTAANSYKVEKTPDSPLTGASSNPMLPNNVAWAIKFNTGFRGRSYRGRNYLFGLTTNQRETNNTLTSSAAATFVEGYSALAFGSEVLPAGWTWVVASRYSAGASRTTGISTPVLTVSYSDLTLDSQRKRLPGRGQ